VGERLWSAGCGVSGRQGHTMLEPTAAGSEHKIAAGTKEQLQAAATCTPRRAAATASSAAGPKLAPK